MNSSSVLTGKSIHVPFVQAIDPSLAVVCDYSAENVFLSKMMKAYLVILKSKVIYLISYASGRKLHVVVGACLFLNRIRKSIFPFHFPTLSTIFIWFHVWNTEYNNRKLVGKFSAILILLEERKCPVLM